MEIGFLQQQTCLSNMNAHWPAERVAVKAAPTPLREPVPLDRRRAAKRPLVMLAWERYLRVVVEAALRQQSQTRKEMCRSTSPQVIMPPIQVRVIPATATRIERNLRSEFARKSTRKRG